MAFDPIPESLEDALCGVLESGAGGMPLDALRELERLGILRDVGQDILGNRYATPTERGRSYDADKAAWEEERAERGRGRRLRRSGRTDGAVGPRPLSPV